MSNISKFSGAMTRVVQDTYESDVAYTNVNAKPCHSQQETILNSSSWLKNLFHAHSGSLIRYLQHKYGGGPPDPEDIAQDAFAKMATFIDIERNALVNPRAFLYRVAENLLITAKRRSYLAASHASEMGKLEASGSELTPERVLAARRQLDAVEKVIKAMPEARRRCFIMHRYDELSFTEIARRSGISPNGVKGHVERAMRDISLVLNGTGDEPCY